MKNKSTPYNSTCLYFFKEGFPGGHSFAAGIDVLPRIGGEFSQVFSAARHFEASAPGSSACVNAVTAATRPAPPAPASLPEASPESAAAAVYAPEAEPARWLLAERAGQVAVYCGGKKLFVTDIEPAILRSSDRELLRRGIEADSMEAVLMLIEDLSS